MSSRDIRTLHYVVGFLAWAAITASAAHAGAQDKGASPALGGTGLKGTFGLGGMSRIVGGVVVRRGDWPWQVAIYDRSSFVCGGSVIAANWILTAAHCVTDAKLNSLGAENFVVLEGAPDIVKETASLPSLKEGRALRVRRVLVHEQYGIGEVGGALKVENDIALLELAEPARSAPVPYADSRSAAAAEVPGNRVIATGWGKIRPYRHTTNGPVDPETDKPIGPAEFKEKYETTKLMQVEMPLVAVERCQAAYRNGFTKIAVEQHQLCAGLPEGGKNACNGDSGGPLMARTDNGYVQIGVTSFVADNTLCAMPGLPGVFTQVSAYEPWLREKTGVNQNVASTETQAVAANIGGSNRAGLSVSLVQGPRVRVGQRVQFRVTARKAGYLVLLDVGPSGSVTQIYPNPFSIQSRLGGIKASSWFDPTRPLIVPDAKNLLQNFDLTASAPTGTGKLVAVLSGHPIEIFHTSADRVVMAKGLRSYDTRAKALSALGVLTRVVQHDLSLEPGVQPPSVAISEYAITR